MRTTRLLAGLTAGMLAAGCVTTEPTGSAPAVKTEAKPALKAAPSAASGFHTEMDKNGRLWVLRAGSPELAEFKEKGEPVKVVVRPSAGPGGITIKSVDTETLDAFQSRLKGFHTERDKNGRLWVFKAGSPALAEFKEKGEPVKVVVRPSAGPGGLTIKSVDSETLDAFQAAIK